MVQNMVKTHSPNRKQMDVLDRIFTDPHWQINDDEGFKIFALNCIGQIKSVSPR